MPNEQADDYDIVGSYNNQLVSNIDSERTVNMFEYIDPRGKKGKVLINTSGLRNSDQAFPGATGGFRAQFTFQDAMYHVIGNSVFRSDAANIVSFLGNIGTSIGYVGIDANTFQVIFVDGLNGWIWDTRAQTFQVITDLSFPPQPIDVCALDGFFVVAQGSTPFFQLSSLNQGMVWGESTDSFTADATTDLITVASTANYATGVSVQFSVSGGGVLPTPLNNTETYYVIRVDNMNLRVATSYQNAISNIFIDLTTNGSPVTNIINIGQVQQGAITTHPGNIVACRTLHRRLFLFSDFFTEVWENAGAGAILPFRRNNSLLMEYGTTGRGSVAVGFDRMFFLSQERDGLGSVMGVYGTQPMPVSARALDSQLSIYDSTVGVGDCRAFLMKENGLIFYRMNFTAANHTFVFNVSLSGGENLYWHEEEVLNGDRHPAQTHAFFNGINYVGNYSSPNLYIVDNTFFTNDGESIRRMRIGRPFVPPGYQRTRVDRFQLDLLQGTKYQLETIDEEDDVFLFTEDDEEILTETDIPLLLEQGITITTDPIDPWVFLSISRDGGNTYGYIMRAPMGQYGEREFRTLWRKLGVIPRGQAYVPKLEFYDPIPFIILGGAWAYEIMPE